MYGNDGLYAPVKLITLERIMKKYLIIVLLSLLGFSQSVSAQESEYVPFVREGVQWVCYYNNIGSYPYKDQYFHPGKNYFTLEIKGDTLIDGKTYKEKYDKLISEGLCLQPRWGYPEDIGRAVAMLLRGDLAYSTGQVINVDGGMTIQKL